MRKLRGLSRIEQWFKRTFSRKHDVPPPLLDISVAPIWEDTDFLPILSEITSQSSSWPDTKLLASADAEISSAKAAYMRHAPLSSLRHLYRALAFRTLAHAGETPELIGNIGWQLSEVGDYRKARDLGCFGYDLRLRTRADPRALAVSAVKLAIYNFYLGRLNESRQWLNGVRPSERNSEYSIFEQKLSLCEEAFKALNSKVSPTGDFDLPARNAETSAAEGRFSSALGFFAQALAVAEDANDYSGVYRCCLGVADILYEKCGFYLESATWYLKAFRSALVSDSFEKAAEVLLRAGHASLETGDFVATASLLRQGITELTGNCSGISVSRMFSLLSFSVAWRDPNQALEYLSAAVRELSNSAIEEILEWSLAFGRLFVGREQLELAVKCLNVGFERVADGSYYSERAAGLFQELAHIQYLRQRWTTCLIVINEGRNRSYQNHDFQGVCLALVHTARVYRDVNERELAEKTIRTALAISKQLTNVSVGDELHSLAAEVLFGQQALSGQRSPWTSGTLVMLRELPGTDDFNHALASLRNMVSQVEAEGRDITKFESDAFRFPFILRSYGIGLDRAGHQREARHYLVRAFRLHKGFKDYPEAATAIHEYAVASARIMLHSTAKRAFLVALTYKQRYGSTTTRVTDSLLGYVKASIILGDTAGLDARLKDLEAEAGSATSGWQGPEALDELGVLLNVAEGYLLLQNIGEAERIITRAKSILPNHFSQVSPLDFSQLSRLELKLGRPSEAFRFAKQGMSVIEEGRLEIVGPNRREWQRYGTVVAAAVVNAAYALGMPHAGEALRATELVKVRSLLEQFGRAHVPAPAGLPKAFREQDDELRRNSFDILLKLQTAPSEQKDQLLTELARIERSEQELFGRIPSGFEHYARLRGGNPLDPSEVMDRQLSSERTEFLVMFPAEDGVFVWHFDGGGNCKSWRRVELPKGRLWQVVVSIQEDIGRGQWNSALLDELTQKLVGDFISSVNDQTTLCLVIGGPLLQIPFAAARIGTSYLAERHPLAILPSFSVAGYWNFAADATARGAIVFADSLGDLPYARKEGSVVAGALGCDQEEGKKISREMLLLKVAQCDLVHIACHAQYDSSDPLNSGILLSGKKHFTCRDLMTVTSRAKFAFLVLAKAAG